MAIFIASAAVMLATIVAIPMTTGAAYAGGGKLINVELKNFRTGDIVTVIVKNNDVNLEVVKVVISGNKVNVPITISDVDVSLVEVCVKEDSSGGPVQCKDVRLIKDVVDVVFVKKA